MYKHPLLGGYFLNKMIITKLNFNEKVEVPN